MNTSFYLLLVCAIITVANAAQFIIPYDPKNPGPSGYCHSDITGPLKKNEVKALKDCTQATCGENKFITVVSCGVVATPTDPKCKLIEDKTKPYPKCCKDVTCS